MMGGSALLQVGPALRRAQFLVMQFARAIVPLEGHGAAAATRADEQLAYLAHALPPSGA